MIYFVPTPIGNLGDITQRALEIFAKAELFLCEDTRKTKQLLTLLSQESAINDKAEFLSFHEHNGKERLKQVKERLESQEVVYVSDAGMPVISDPGQLLVEYAQQNAIEYDVLPGATALSVAYAASGMGEGAFAFYAFLPHKGQERKERLETILQSPTVSILYEAPHRLLKLLEAIASVAPQRELFLAKELTKRYQRYYKQEAQQLYEQFQNETIRGEWVVVIAPQPQQQQQKSLSFEALLSADIPPKPKAKLLAKLDGNSTKYWYEKLTKI